MSVRLTPLVLAFAAVAIAPLAQAAGTAAGTSISNTATASFTDPSGTPRSTDSNTYVVKVDEILDVTVQSDDGGNVGVYTPSTAQVLTFTVKNTGNGSETYRLTAQSTLTGDNFDPTNVKVYLDNGNGVLDTGPGGDTLLVPGTNDPTLAEDASIKVFVVSDIPASLVDGNIGNVRLIAESATAQTHAGLEAAGYVFTGLGTGGTDALVGTTQAYAGVTNGYVISQVSSSFVKSSTIVDPFGTNHPVPGAVITYSLALSLTGSGTVTGTKIVDAIPTGTTYKAGSIKLDGVSQTDAADADKGRFTGTQVEVDLGNLTVPASHTVTFDVTITP